MNEARPRTLDEVVGERVRALREVKGSTQERLARRMRVSGGFDWQQNTVSAVETGRRSLSLLELGYLAWWGEKDVAWFVEGEGPIWLSGAVLSAETLALMLRGRPIKGGEVPWATVEQIIHGGKAEQMGAQRLGVEVGVLHAAAIREWGRSLSDERDRRVAEQDDGSLSARSIQGLRGHVTRRLVDELRAVINTSGGPRARRPGRKP